MMYRNYAKSFAFLSVVCVLIASPICIAGPDWIPKRSPPLGHIKLPKELKLPEGLEPPETSQPPYLSQIQSPGELNLQELLNPPHLELAGTKESFDLYDNSEVQSAAQDYAVAHFRHETDLLAETRWTIRIENGIGYFIFVVVHFLLGLAVWAAIREYKQASRDRKDVEKLSDETPTELKVSLEGVALKTSLHGTVLLVLSLAFYFIYVKFIYGITAI